MEVFWEARVAERLGPEDRGVFLVLVISANVDRVVCVVDLFVGFERSARPSPAPHSAARPAKAGGTHFIDEVKNTERQFVLVERRCVLKSRQGYLGLLRRRLGSSLRRRDRRVEIDGWETRREIQQDVGGL